MAVRRFAAVLMAMCTLVAGVVVVRGDSSESVERFSSTEYAQALLSGRGPAAELLLGGDVVSDQEISEAGMDPAEYDSLAISLATEILQFGTMEGTFAEAMSSGRPELVDTSLQAFGDAALGVLEIRYGAQAVDQALNGNGGACAPWACVAAVYMVAAAHTVAVVTAFVGGVVGGAVVAAGWLKVGLWSDDESGAGAALSRDQFVADLAIRWRTS